MDINRGNLEALFKTYSTAWQDVAGTNPLAELGFAMSEFPSSSASNFYAWLDQVPGFRKWVGDRVFNHLKSQRFEVVNEDYEDSVRLGANDLEDDQYGVYAPVVRMMAQSWLELKRELVIAVFTANRVTFTGQPLFSATHAYGAQTLSNTVTDALTAEHFEAAFQAAAGWRFSDGRLVKPRFTHLVVGEALRATAWNIVKNNRLETGTVGATVDNRNFNRCELVIWPELSGDYANYWFLVDATKPVKAVALQVRKEAAPLMDTDPATVQRTGHVDVLASGRLAAAPTFPHLVYGGLVAAA